MIAAAVVMAGSGMSACSSSTSASTAPTTASSVSSVATGHKVLTADATEAFGACPTGGVYCGANSHSCNKAAFSTAGCPHPVAGGTQVVADCWTVGLTVTSGIGNTSTTWIHVPTYVPSPWMSNMYFSNWTTAADNLPRC
jgi:hypothetical protein